MSPDTHPQQLAPCARALCWACETPSISHDYIAAVVVGEPIALAEFERDLIRERTVAGLAPARVKGRHGGRPPVMTAHKLRVAHEMYRSGQNTVTAIATTLGVSRASVYRHLDGASQ